MIRKLNGMEASISEYALGIEVFRRDARDYDTTTDPVVRVQMGRLRDRLAEYYATAGNCGGLRIAIPAGTYVPELTPCEAKRSGPSYEIRLAPLRMLNTGSGSSEFIAGLEDELALQLFQRFGSGRDSKMSQQHRFEVSVRLENCRARASIKLIHAATGGIVNLQQCDCHGDGGIALQEKLALKISDVVTDLIHFSQNPSPRRLVEAART